MPFHATASYLRSAHTLRVTTCSTVNTRIANIMRRVRPSVYHVPPDTDIARRYVPITHTSHSFVIGLRHYCYHTTRDAATGLMPPESLRYYVIAHAFDAAAIDDTRISLRQHVPDDITSSEKYTAGIDYRHNTRDCIGMVVCIIIFRHICKKILAGR